MHHWVTHSVGSLPDFKYAAARNAYTGLQMSYRKLILLSSLVVLLASLSAAQRHARRLVKRPAIVGVAHIGLKTDDLAGARNFYGHYLGYQEPFTLDKASGGLMLT